VTTDSGRVNDGQTNSVLFHLCRRASALSFRRARANIHDRPARVFCGGRDDEAEVRGIFVAVDVRCPFQLLVEYLKYLE
jgi:hypothetical protein